jgi:outer membrane immunogenic protein
VKSDVTRDGHAVGAGGQYKIAPNLSLSLEYLYQDFCTKSITFDSSGLGKGLAGQVLTIDSKLKLNLFKAALNYHF